MLKPRQKFYTPKAANQLLPVIKEELDEILAKKRERDVIKKNLDILLQSGQADRYDGLRKQLEVVTEELETWIERLQSKGVILRDIEQGLVDFPGVRFGELVYLCWKRGEPQVGFWHDVKEGYAGRKPLQVDGDSLV